MLIRLGLDYKYCYISLVISQRDELNNLAEVCLSELGIGGNYVRYLVISMELGGPKRCWGGFKVIIWRETGEGGKLQKWNLFSW